MEALGKWKVPSCFLLKSSGWIRLFFAFPYDEKWVLKLRKMFAGEISITRMQNLNKKSIYKKTHSRSSSITECQMYY